MIGLEISEISPWLPLLSDDEDQSDDFPAAFFSSLAASLAAFFSSLAFLLATTLGLSGRNFLLWNEQVLAICVQPL
jgi:hypothetical protein